MPQFLITVSGRLRGVSQAALGGKAEGRLCVEKHDKAAMTFPLAELPFEESEPVLLRRRNRGWVEPAGYPLHGQSLHDDGEHDDAVADW